MCHEYSPQGDQRNFQSQPQSKARANGKEAGRDLARLMERQLGYAHGHIDPVALRLFIRAYWSRVSAFAHTIHDEAE
jgi:hypothetical protein